ncbi:hypothetical protein [Streptomyces sp. NBC_01727]|uniref:hypothetical protein n=1 Tax=Streptomyces sp. NBC_01727 TaxID=2975924 RepID=UPI002E13F8D5|nr:hypothetical protein OIE76_40925 [Streptomyces sp. NBC_01727]
MTSEPGTRGGFGGTLSYGLAFHAVEDPSHGRGPPASPLAGLRPEHATADPAAATHKVDSFNRFFQWVGFGNQGVLSDSTHELADEPDAYDPRLDVDFTPIRGDGPPADGFGQAA